MYIVIDPIAKTVISVAYMIGTDPDGYTQDTEHHYIEWLNKTLVVTKTAAEYERAVKHRYVAVKDKSDLPTPNGRSADSLRAIYDLIGPHCHRVESYNIPYQRESLLVADSVAHDDRHKGLGYFHMMGHTWIGRGVVCRDYAHGILPAKLKASHVAQMVEWRDTIKIRGPVIRVLDKNTSDGSGAGVTIRFSTRFEE